MVTLQKRALFSNEARAGLLIIFAILVVIFGIAFLREYSFKKENYELVARFDTVIGLDKDDPVIVSGLKVGKVHAMHLGKDKVEVVLAIDEKYHFPKDSRAILKNLTLLGEKAIEIVRGDSTEFLPDGAVIEGSLEADIFELTEAAAPIGEDLAVLLKRFRATFNEDAQADIQVSLRNARAISTEVAERFGKNLDDLQEAVKNMSRVAHNLQEITNPNARNLDEIVAALKESSVNLKEASAQIRTSSASLERILGRVERGEGSVGRLLKDEAIFDNLESATAHLDSLILDITQNPRKYLKVSVF
ncbi:MAG: MlaD family protein [bacterium]